MPVIHKAWAVLACVLFVAACAGRDEGALQLDNGSAGQDIPAHVGQEIDLTLQTIGPGQFEAPAISAPAVRFLGSALASVQNPGGPRQIYRFEVVAPGRAEIRIPHAVNPTAFTLTVVAN
jgi:hypothetical protein